MLMLLSVHVTRVLFLVLAGNFALTMGFYWSYTLLLKSPVLMHSCSIDCFQHTTLSLGLFVLVFWQTVKVSAKITCLYNKERKPVAMVMVTKPAMLFLLRSVMWTYFIYNSAVQLAPTDNMWPKLHDEYTRHQWLKG